MKSIKTSISARLAALLVGAAMLGLVSQGALALTNAGTTISNTSTLTYTVGGVAQNSIDSSPTGNSTANNCTTTACAGTGGGAATTFLVDYKVDLFVSGGIVKNVSPGQAAATPATAATGAYVTFTVQNLSNATTDFLLTAADAAIGTNPAVLANKVPATAGGDLFDSTGAPAIYLENNTTAGFSADEGAPVTQITLAAAGLAGDTATIYVATAIPLTATNAQSSLVSLHAQAAWGAALPAWAPTGVEPGNVAAATNTAIVATAAATPNNAGTTVDIVFGDTTAGVIDGVRDGIDSAYDAYTVSAASLTVTKSAAVYSDPVNGTTDPKMIPGAVVTYTITIANAAGGATASSVAIADSLAAEIGAGTLLLNSPFVDATNDCSGLPGVIVVAGGGEPAGGTCKTAAADAEAPTAADFSANVVNASGLSIAAGASATIKFQVVVQ